ncbi:MAG: FAD-binding oxidoreductase [Candidatus Dormibacteraeota bacterium]|nr:FAD-binding oxidoreductase [Candidatus Dormibacteraeota bacterium]
MILDLSVDDQAPSRSERPDSPEQLAEALQASATGGEKVIPVGGGRLLGLGNPPSAFDVTLSTRGLNRIVEFSPADLVVSVEAGVTLEELDAELGRAGMCLPLDPPAGPGHTVGGVLASGMSGPLALRFGRSREFVIGLRVALPDGRLVASGGRVVKNVSGYDMNKLHQGALGTLGVIVAASFKVFPRPLAELTLQSQPDDPWAEAERALRLPQPPVALELDSSGGLLARFWGTQDGVARMQRELGWEETAVGRWESGRGREAGWAEPVWAWLSVPRAQLRRVLDGLPAGARWLASPGLGVAHWLGLLGLPELRSARTAAESAGGVLVLVAAPRALKEEFDAWGAPPPNLDWMQRLRTAFDPQRTLSPGRFVV